MAEESLPTIALRGLTVLPSQSVNVDLVREQSVRAAEKAMTNKSLVFLVTQKNSELEEPSGEEDFCDVGVAARILRILHLPNQTVRIMVNCLYRASWTKIESADPYFVFSTRKIEAEPVNRVESMAMVQVLQELMQTYLALEQKPNKDLQKFANPQGSINIEEWMDQMMAAVSSNNMEARQGYLECVSLTDRFSYLGTLISDENEVGKIRQDFQEKVTARLDKNQKEYILREQIRLLHEELGDIEPEDETDRMMTQLDELTASPEVKEKIEKEIKRLSALPQGSQEYSVEQTYIDHLLEMPWDKEEEEQIDLKEAERILERDHYGLEKVKERVLEYLAVRKLCKEQKSGVDDAPILCLVGPPGTGKTSIAHSVAEALGKKYVRVCLGGVRDEAEIRGHRRTYVGAMPGRIVDGICQAGVKNPLMLLDEIDKMSSDYKGDVASAMLEVLDPEQNIHFRDHYLEIPIDLSGVLFIATANTTDTIPRALLDRMEVIEVGSYTENEKFHIAKKYLVKKQTAKNGLTPKQFSVSDGALRRLIHGYVREAGVRELERKIGSLCRKSARMILDGETESVKVLAKDLEPMLGKEPYHTGENAGEDEVGIVHGLAWTSVGGEMLEIEVNTMPGKGELQLTGNLGDVMKESAMAALTYVRSVLPEETDADYFEHHDLHIHVPEGAVPKDGPSAGITLATAIYSAVTGRKVYADVAMTGEITLRGRVMPIGGLKEKLLAAKTAHMKKVLVPEENRADVSELSEEITDGLTIVYVEKMDLVLKEALC